MRVGINRRLMFALLVAMTLSSGCYDQRSGESFYTESVSEEERPGQEADYREVPYSQLLYSKTAPDFTWEYRTEEHLDSEIEKLYEDGIHLAPGGWVLKETDEEFYMLISGGFLPTSKGFRITSIQMAGEQKGNDKNHLYITLEPHQGDGTKDYPGDASITSLISIPKSGLPAGAAIDGVSMNGVE